MFRNAWHQIRNSLQHVSAPAGDAPFLPELTLNALNQFRQYQGLLGLNLRTPSGSLLAGQHRSRHQGRGMELSEIRNYQPGDDIRLMDWKVTARTRRPHTKVFLEERERPVHLIVDLSQSMLFGSIRSKAEQAANAAATLGWALTHQGDRCGGLVFNGHQSRLFRPKARQKGLLPLLQHCCHLGQQLQLSGQASEAGRMNQLLRQLSSQPGHGALVIVISDFWSLNLQDNSILCQISRNHTLVALQVHDPLEHRLPPSSCFLTDGEQDYFYDGLKNSEQVRYRHSFEQHQEALRQCLNKARAHLIPLSTHESAPDKLKQFFAKASR